MVEKFYTYIHRKADSGDVFYVGKGTGRRHGDRQKRNQYWQEVVRQHGLITEIVQYHLTSEEALIHERALIAQYVANGFSLTNLNAGGQGGPRKPKTDEQRRKSSEALKGRKWTPEQRVIYLEALKKRPKHLTEAHKKKISEAKKGVCTHNPGALTQEQKERISQTLKGRPKAPGMMARLADANRGRPLDMQHREKISTALKGKAKPKFSEEHRANMSRARKAYFEKKRMASAEST